MSVGGGADVSGPLGGDYRLPTKNISPPWRICVSWRLARLAPGGATPILRLGRISSDQSYLRVSWSLKTRGSRCRVAETQRPRAYRLRRYLLAL